MKKYPLKINGMSGEHCVMVIKNILAKINGANAVLVEAGKAEIELDETKTSREAVITAIEKMGYKVEQ